MFVYNECIEKSLNKLTSTAGELIEFVYKGFLLTFYLTELYNTNAYFMSNFNLRFVFFFYQNDLKGTK